MKQAELPHQRTWDRQGWTPGESHLLLWKVREKQARKLQATLVQNYHRLADSLTGVKCRAISVAKNQEIDRYKSMKVLEQWKYGSVISGGCALQAELSWAWSWWAGSQMIYLSESSAMAGNSSLV